MDSAMRMDNVHEFHAGVCFIIHPTKLEQVTVTIKQPIK